MRRMFLMSSVLLTVPFYAGTAGAEVCIAEEDCNNLGYTEDKACTDGLKCPFGEKWHCPDKKCQIGWILNSDMSCTENVESGKTPIAVVVYMDDNGNGQAMTASPINSSSLTWSSTAMAKTDIPSLPNIMQNQFATDINSCQNSFYIAAYGDSSKFPAVWAAKNYTPAAAPNTKWKWCLPSAGILRSVIDNKEVINKAIDLLGGRRIEETSSKNEGILSSSEADGTWIWEICYSRDLCTLYKDYTNGNFLYSVRPVIEFNIDTGAAECKKLPDETGCTGITITGDDGCGGTRKTCCTPTGTSDAWCPSHTVPVDWGDDGCGNTIKKCRSRTECRNSVSCGSNGVGTLSTICTFYMDNGNSYGNREYKIKDYSYGTYVNCKNQTGSNPPAKGVYECTNEYADYVGVTQKPLNGWGVIYKTTDSTGTLHRIRIDDFGWGLATRSECEARLQTYWGDLM